MRMIKEVGKFLFGKEIKELEIKTGGLESLNESLQEDLKGLRTAVENDRKEKEQYQEDNFKLQKRVEELEKENEILRKYYDLDSEPSDEIKAKIHIDLELNRVKEEYMKMLAMHAIASRPMYLPYPVYPGRIL